MGGVSTTSMINVSSVSVWRWEGQESGLIEDRKPALMASLKVFFGGGDAGLSSFSGLASGPILAFIEADRLAVGESGLSTGGEKGRSRKLNLSCSTALLSGEKEPRRAESGGIAIIDVVFLREFFHDKGGRLRPRFSSSGVELDRLWPSRLWLSRLWALDSDCGVTEPFLSRPLLPFDSERNDRTVCSESCESRLSK